MRLKLDFEDVYETCREGGTFALMASFLDDGYVTWFDLTHSRCFDVAEVLLDEPHEFRWRNRHGRVFWLRALRLAHPARERFLGPPTTLADFKAAIRQVVEVNCSA